MAITIGSLRPRDTQACHDVAEGVDNAMEKSKTMPTDNAPSRAGARNLTQEEFNLSLAQRRQKRDSAFAGLDRLGRGLQGGPPIVKFDLGDSVTALERLVNNLRSRGVRNFKGDLRVGADTVWTVELQFERPEVEGKRSRYEDDNG